MQKRIEFIEIDVTQNNLSKMIIDGKITVV